MLPFFIQNNLDKNKTVTKQLFIAILTYDISQFRFGCMRKNYRIIIKLKNLLLALSCGFFLCLPATSLASEEIKLKPVSSSSSCKNIGPITFGILPFISAEQLVIRFTPLAQYLSDKLNTTVRIETAPNFSEFAHRTNKLKRYDILFTAPHFYPTANSKAGYQLVAGVDSPGMWAIIVTPKTSKIHTLNDLRGTRLATIHPKGLATLLVRKHLLDAGINPDTDITMIATPSHDASLLSSFHGVTDASALMQPPFAGSDKHIKQSMRIIARTDSTPHIPISVSTRINQKCSSEISKTLLEMNLSEKGRAALHQNNFSGFKNVTNKDYDKMKELLSQ